MIKMGLEEKWLPIKGYNGEYEISDAGMVRSLKNYNNVKKRILRTYFDGGGYKVVDLSIHGNQKRHKIHHLVYDAFGDGERNGHKLQVDHIDGNKTNNCIGNLQLLSNRENSVKYYNGQESTSKHIGVSWSQNRGKWLSRIVIDGKTVHLGYFSDEIKASAAYQDALRMFEKTAEVVVVTPAMKRKKSKYRGVSWEKSNGKWRARLCVKYKSISLGLFDKEIDAHLAYEQAIANRQRRQYELPKNDS